MFLKIKMKAHFPENVLFSLRELRLIAPLQQQSASNFCEAKRVFVHKDTTKKWNTEE